TVNGKAGLETLDKITRLVNSEYAPGKSGQHVSDLKRDLTALGFGNFPSSPSENYAEVTAKVVKEFQSYAKLPTTGIADEDTLNRINEVLNPPYKNGDRGIAIVEIKNNLSELNYGNFPENPSINYGKVTANVVKDFQKDKGLKV